MEPAVLKARLWRLTGYLVRNALYMKRFCKHTKEQKSSKISLKRTGIAKVVGYLVVIRYKSPIGKEPLQQVGSH